jgi:prepilin-type N-terminal cleavage/methylation domain-containing protein
MKFIPSICRKGFTLLEIMIVVAIIGLLAAIAIPSYVSARLRASTTACINNLRQIDSAKSQWALETKRLATALPTDADLFGPSLYLKKKPECPAGGLYTVDIVSSPPSCDQPAHTLN